MCSCLMQDKNKAVDDTVFAFTCVDSIGQIGSPPHACLVANVHHHCRSLAARQLSLPQGSSYFPKVNGQSVLDGHQGAICKKIADHDTTLLFDEWTDECGVPVLAITAHVGGRSNFCQRTCTGD